MSLSSHIQTVRKLKPFLDAASALVEMAEKLQGLDQQVIDAEARVARARQDEDSAKALADIARATASETVAKAKEESERIALASEANLALAQKQMQALVLETETKTAKQLSESVALMAKHEESANALHEAVKSKLAEAEALDARIAAARETIRKQLEV